MTWKRFFVTPSKSAGRPQPDWFFYPKSQNKKGKNVFFLKLICNFALNKYKTE